MTLARLARILRQRWRSVARWRAADRDLDAELEFHLEQLAAEKMADGLSAENARQAAVREFGSVTVVAEAARDARGFTWFRDFAVDVRYAARMLRRAPAFTVVAITSLALGIGSAATVLAAARAVFWTPLPFPDADRLVAVRTIGPEAPDRPQGVSLTEYDAWKTRSRRLEAIGLSLSSPRDLGAEPDGPSGDRLASQAFTPELFRLLGARAHLGRLFEDAPSPYHDAARVMVISHRLWQSRYGGSPEVIGRQVPTEGSTRTIVGVMSPDFGLQDGNVAFWIPLIPGPASDRAATVGRPFGVKARLSPGTSIAEAERELTGILDDLVRTLPERFRGRRAFVQPLHETMYGWTRPLLATLFAAAALLLAIACANVTGLLLARGTTRRREVWVRLSLGAARGRIVRQLFGESALLAGAGGVLGLGVAAVGVRVLTFALGPPPGSPPVAPIPFDLPVAAAVAALSALAAILFGLPTALAGVRAGARAGARSTANAAGDPKTTRTRGAIVAAEVALAMLLLVVAGLLGHSLGTVLGRPLNFDPERLGSFRYVVPQGEFAQQAGFDGVLPVFRLSSRPADAVTALHERLRSVPGIEAIGGMTYQPVNSLITPKYSVWPAGTPAPGPREAAKIAGYLVTPGFFVAMRTPIVRGREAVDGDIAAAPPVAIVNESAAQLLFPGQEALGRRIVVDFAAGAPAREIVGVAANVPIIRRVLDPQPIVYVPVRQMPSVFKGGSANVLGVMTFVFRYAGDEAAALASLRRAAAEVDPGRPIVEAGIVGRALNGRVSEQVTYVSALSAFGIVATLLAAIGVYGVTAFATAARTREIAIRRALGAERRAIVVAVAHHTLWLVAAGIAAGLTAAAALTPLVESQLVGVRPLDPATFLAAAALLGGVASIAGALPARRALAVAPAVVLRAE